MKNIISKKLLLFFHERPVAVIIFFFLISVAIRLPNLDRPLSKHHELNPALVLINAEEWNRKTPAFYNYIPVHSYHQPGDNIYNNTSKEQPAYLINISFGSLWYLIPYAFFKLLQSEPSPLLLQIFNLLLHFITVLLIYKLALYLFQQQNDFRYKAIATSLVYLFSPAPLWFHGNGYVHEIAVLPFIFSAILVYINLLKFKPGLFKYILLTILIFAGICCDWLMCFVAAAMFVSTLIERGKDKKWNFKLLAAIALGVIGAILFTVWQFSSFLGFQNYLNGLLSRFLLRGVSGTAEGGGLSEGTGIASFYVSGYGLFLLLIFFAFFFLKQRSQHIRENSRLKNFLLVAASVCLLHHVIFWGFTNIHDYSVIKSGIIISLISTVAFFSIKQKEKKIIVFAVIIIGNTGIYYFINPPGKYAANGQEYSYFKDLGEKIKTIATPEDYIFIDTPEMSLLLTYYSKRYYRNVRDVTEAEKLFNTLPGNNALFIKTSNFKFVGYKQLEK